MAVTPYFIIAADNVLVRTDAVVMSASYFSGDTLESDGGLELGDMPLKFFLVSGK